MDERNEWMNAMNGLYKGKKSQDKQVYSHQQEQLYLAKHNN